MQRSPNAYETCVDLNANWREENYVYTQKNNKIVQSDNL